MNTRRLKSTWKTSRDQRSPDVNIQEMMAREIYQSYIRKSAHDTREWFCYLFHPKGTDYWEFPKCYGLGEWIPSRKCIILKGNLDFRVFTRQNVNSKVRYRSNRPKESRRRSQDCESSNFRDSKAPAMASGKTEKAKVLTIQFSEAVYDKLERGQT
ncbi:hypothetical protein EVAR_12588_1 [Eumeta japonica]|uniref:Uncharacterized protein n=1 Tax=Eumeta variegata TaxID=151549 RepID=A0A4C1UG17_EUMVA|nr:hypothetical protein EVAR_12588_1 [Eumeta japonica]